MNKSELVDAIAVQTSETKTVVGAVLDGLFGVLKGQLASGGAIAWTGFGTFEVAQRAARMGRNPRDGSELHIPAKKVLKFKAGKGLKDAAEGKV